MSHERYVPPLFLFHGGGPMPLLGQSPELVALWEAHARDFYAASPPETIVVVSAHYHARKPSVCGVAEPRMIYDYGGFPPESYSYRYPAPGNVALARTIVERMRARGLDAELSTDWGFDHGVFVPLMIMFPEARIPVVPMSVQAADEDAETQLRMGEALQGLAGEGVLLLGSGASNHNFKYFFGSGTPPRSFDDALNDVMCNPSHTPAERRAKLLDWRTLPAAEEYQPRGGADHFLPLLTIAAAAEYRPARSIRYGDRLRFSHFVW